MTYGRTPLQELNLEGRRLLSRHFYGDGRWGWPQRTHRQDQVWADWRVVKHRPKVTVWARATGSTRARKIHAIRYSLTATHARGSQVYLTVWQCGGHANSKPLPETHPRHIRPWSALVASRNSTGYGKPSLTQDDLSPGNLPIPKIKRFDLTTRHTSC